MLHFALVYAVSIFVGILVATEVGWRVGRGTAAHGGGGASTGLIDGTVHTLFGLLLAFTFSGAAARFDQRRELIIAEAEAMDTAYSRLDTLPTEARPPLQALLRQYVSTRLATYRAADLDVALQEFDRGRTLLEELWDQAVPAVDRSPNPTTQALVLTGLDEMGDLATTRLALTHVHPLPTVYAMLFGFGLLSSFVAGVAIAKGGKRAPVHVLVYGLAIAGTTYVILDLEYPRLGVMRVDPADVMLSDVLERMH